MYLDDPAPPEMDNDAFDIIAWFKISNNRSHGTRHPKCSLSAVASESAFSLAGLVFYENRSSLLPEMCT